MSTAVSPLRTLRRLGSAAAALGLLLLLGACERPPMDSVQRGWRGSGMLQVYNPRAVQAKVEENVLPAEVPAASAEGPRAKDVLKNVQVLGDLSISAFTRHMAAITSWVAPVEGCAYCHNLQDLADDSKYTKVVARRMIQMTQQINGEWKNHVAATGVTCYTCHRGNHIPAQLWTAAPPQDKRSDFIGNRNGQNAPAQSVKLASLPYDPFSSLLTDPSAIRVGGPKALRTDYKSPIQKTENTYALMVHMSDSLGVNCTYCHNSRNFASWAESTPQRVTAWHGLRMVRSINSDYMEPLGSVFPDNRKGPMGDVGKVYCGTCHQGAFKPLFGAAMAKGYPELLTPVVARVPAPAASAPEATSGLPAPVAEAERSVLYFDKASPELKDDQAAGLAQIIATLKAKPDSNAVISGFHSAAGSLKFNQELAKQRAFKVRDALVAGGVAVGRVKLQKPQKTEANVAGEDPTARRVEVTIQ